MHLDTICGLLSQIAPLKLAESWDNVGLLVGDRQSEISNIMTCLTVTPAVVAEAIEQEVDLLVTHHPLPFQPLKRITSDTNTGKMLLDLIRNGIAIYSAHTAYDSVLNGINQQWCQKLGIENSKPLVEISESLGSQTASGDGKPASHDHSLGSGRYGRLKEPETLIEVGKRATTAIGAPPARIVGNSHTVIKKVGFACGSGGSFLASAARCGCDALITGEATFHVCLEAESKGIGLILLGHYYSERFAMESMAEMLSEEFPDLRIWASEQETDPILGG